MSYRAACTSNGSHAFRVRCPACCCKAETACLRACSDGWMDRWSLLSSLRMHACMQTTTQWPAGGRGPAGPPSEAAVGLTALYSTDRRRRIILSFIVGPGRSAGRPAPAHARRRRSPLGAGPARPLSSCCGSGRPPADTAPGHRGEAMRGVEPASRPPCCGRHARATPTRQRARARHVQ